MATQKHVLTKEELDKSLQKNREDIVDAIFEYINQNSATKAQVEELAEKINHLPTKDEFYEETARIYSRLDTVETQHAILADQVSRMSDRADQIEKN